VKLEVHNLSFSYGTMRVLKDINMKPLPGKITAIIGPNASGKTTLLKCICGILKVTEGSILFDGKEINKIRREELAKHIAYMPQENPAVAFLTVFETVLLGRLHSLSWRVNDEDLKLTLKTLESLGISELSLRFLSEISAGQRQMVYLAQAIVRQPKVLLLDEPTSNLDLQRQLEVLDLIKELTSEMKITTIIALHDLNLAAKYSDEVIALNSGKVYAAGKPESVLSEEMLRAVYGVDAKVNAHDGVLQITILDSIRKRLVKKKCD